LLIIRITARVGLNEEPEAVGGWQASRVGTADHQSKQEKSE
jgi:hypothetical protein